MASPGLTRNQPAGKWIGWAMLGELALLVWALLRWLLSRTRTAGLIVLSFALLPAIATADPGFTVEAGGGATYNANLFRLQDGVSPSREGLCRNDTVGHAQIAASGNSTAGNWVLSGSASVNHDAYKCNGYLDNTGFAASASISEQSTGRLDVNLHADTSRQLTNFGDLRSLVRNPQTLSRLNGRVTYAVTPTLRVVADPDLLWNMNGASTLKPLDYRQIGAGIGIGYFSPLNNSIVLEVSQQKTRGLHSRPTLVNGAMVDLRSDLVNRAVDAKLVYNVSQFTAIRVILSYVHRTDHGPLRRNFSGIIGEAAFSYMPNPDTTITVRGGRRLQSASYLFVDSVRNEYLNGSVTRAIRPNLMLGVNFDLNSRNFRYDPTSGLGSGRDRQISVGATAKTRLADRFDVELEAGRDVRHGSALFPSYKAASSSIRLSYAFGTRRSAL